jgi:hypothetical protein
MGQTHLSGTAMSLVGGDPGVPMSHSGKDAAATNIEGRIRNDGDGH